MAKFSPKQRGALFSSSGGKWAAEGPLSASGNPLKVSASSPFVSGAKPKGASITIKPARGGGR